ncbi:integrase core domain-containing protein [Epibacterium ulvae]|uniref:integrase core domain-containing protein n=1 Tax=Epibacterium ulvae TaxID=1156985 RepID=UPI003F718CA6
MTEPVRPAWRPTFIGSDNGPLAIFVRTNRPTWLTSLHKLSGINSPPLAPRAPISSDGSPQENGYCESLNGRMRDERLNGEIFYSLYEA